MKIIHSTKRSNDSKELEFNGLYQEHWDLLFKIACKKTGSVQDATDLVQDVFTFIWQNLHSLDLTSGSARPYLVTCLYHRIFNYLRSKGLRDKHYQNFGAFLQNEAVYDPQQDVQALEGEWAALNEAVLLAVKNMPDRMQQIFLLNKYDNKSIDEIADHLSLSRQTVKNQLTIAFKRLRTFAADSPGLLLLILLFGNPLYS